MSVYIARSHVWFVGGQQAGTIGGGKRISDSREFDYPWRVSTHYKSYIMQVYTEVQGDLEGESGVVINKVVLRNYGSTVGGL